MATATIDDGYVLERTEAEYQRLRAQSEVWEPLTGALLADAGLVSGMRCLDVGCGPGEVMRLMGRLVGPTGRVTGLDIDAALGAHTLAGLRRKEGPQFDFVPADFTRGEPVPGAPFDVVFARLLVLHMADPAAAVRRLGTLVRPGGRLVLMDYDMTRMACRPEEPAFDRGLALVTECFRRAGKDADCGLRLAGHLAAAGLPAPRGTRVEGLYGPVAAVGPMLRAALTSLAPAARAFGIAGSGEIEPLLAEIDAVERANAHFALGPLMIGVWTAVG